MAAKRRNWLGYLLILAVVAGGGFYAWRIFAPQAAAPVKAAKPAGPPPAPVTVATVTRQAFPIALSGLGSVQAFNTVTVRTRVDGAIDKIGFTEGQIVKQGDLLAQIDPRPYQATLDAALAKKQQDDSTLANAKLDQQRFATLAKQDFATRQQVDTQNATVAQLSAQLNSDQAQIDNARVQVGYATIKAPFAGRVGFRLVDVGNIVNAATQTGIVTVSQIKPISVVFTAPESQLPSIREALAKGALKVTALTPDAARVLSQGELTAIDNSVDQQTGTIRLKATFANDDSALWPGLSVSTRLLVTTLADVVTAPVDAVQHGPKGLFAYVVNDQNRAQMREIKLRPDVVDAANASGLAVIEAGLEAGEKVIVAGSYRVQPGAQVAPSGAAAPKTAER